MSTKNKTSKTTKSTSKTKQPGQPPFEISTTIKEIIAGGTLDRIPASLIQFHPKNYRSSYSETALQEFAVNLRQNGIISSLLVRPTTNGQFELVAGERRLRASRIAGIDTVPVNIAALSDDQVLDVQLSENLQREDPHPLHDADAITELMARNHSIDEIAARLGKSKTFVYQRQQLSTLTESFREIFVAGRMNLLHALAIAGLEENVQQELFSKHCSDWKEEEHFRFAAIAHLLRQYEGDLSKAPFDTQDSTLLPAAGACTSCPHNSATFSTLFPDMATQAKCHHLPCYQQKCDASLFIQLINLLTEHQPQAILDGLYVTETMNAHLEKIPEAQGLPRYDYYAYDKELAPQPPDREDYMERDDDGTEEFDENGFQLAEEEYEIEREDFQAQLNNGELYKGLLLEKEGIEIVYFSLSEEDSTTTPSFPSTSSATGKVTAKAVQEALKAGTATPELLRAEIDRLNQTEKRKQELDREKIQLAVFETLEKGIHDAYYNECTSADLAAARYLLYRILDYTCRNTFKTFLFGETEYYGEPEELYQRLRELDEFGYAYLIRLALLSQSESKNPNITMGEALMEVATHARVPVAVIEQGQQSRAETRQELQQEKIAVLEKKIAKLEKAKTAAPQA